MPIAPPELPVLSNKKTQKAAVLPAALTECLKMRWNLIIQQKYSFVNPPSAFFLQIQSKPGITSYKIIPRTRHAGDKH